MGLMSLKMKMSWIMTSPIRHIMYPSFTGTKILINKISEKSRVYFQIFILESSLKSFGIQNLAALYERYQVQISTWKVN